MDAVKAAGKDHKLGGPQGVLAMELLELITEQPGQAEVVDEQKGAVGEFRHSLGQKEVEEVMETVPLIKVQKAFSKKGERKNIKIKICIYCSNTVQTCINMWLSANGATRLTGTPAPAATERDLVKMLSKIDEMTKK